MKRRLLIAAALALGLIAPASALADTPPMQDRKDALRFARAFWEERDRYAEDYGCPPRRINTVLYKGRGEYGMTLPGTYCSIFLNTRAGWNGDGNRAKWWNVCATVIHEWGHLVGKRHTRNPESIMAKYGEWNFEASWYPWFPACRYEGDDPNGDRYPDW